MSNCIVNDRIRRTSASFAPRQVASVLVVLVFGSAAHCEEVSFRDQVLPLLSDRCFACHGPDEGSREAELRLDLRELAIEDRGDYRAITPGDAGASEVFARISTGDADLQMPPHEAGRPPLTAKEVNLIRNWINQGAKWEKHWSFERVERPDLPQVDDELWCRNPIDWFVRAQLESERISPSSRASKEKLLRRASLALIGLPPTVADVERFLADKSADAFDQAVDRLLASPHYGERMAYAWLDVARYADTDGFQQDESRDNWPWRDWVIRAYNDNMPFDQFTIEQFAGDLLPNATQDQIIATCFHRNHLTNGEGGRDPAESRVDYVLDRVNTMGTAWLGLTLGCCQCHSHKYDPITQHEYYELTAFFNSIDEDGRAGKSAKPYYAYSTPEGDIYRRELLAPFRKAIAQSERAVKKAEERANSRFTDWLESQAEVVRQLNIDPVDWSPLRSDELTSTDEKLLLRQSEDGSIFVAGGANPDRVDFLIAANTAVASVTALRIEALPHRRHTAGGLARSNSGNIVLTDVEVRVRNPGKRDSLPVKIAFAEADFEQPGFGAHAAIDDRAESGWAVWSGDISRPRSLLLHLAEPLQLDTEAKLVVRLKHQSRHPKHFMGNFRVSITNAASPSLDIYLSGPLTYLRDQKSSDQLSAKQLDELEQFFLTHDGQLGSVRGKLVLDKLKLIKAEEDATVNVMVLRERAEPRKSYLLVRGEWDQHGDEVSRDVPDALGALPADADRSRLALAKWIVDRNNPLTARVAVNRYWQSLFGSGLVRTPEDFGLQGERPTHPQLLDWLAAEFMESGWDIKHIHRLIVTSNTFQQSSKFRADLTERDPKNRMLARGARFRLPAALLRDYALTASGLLTPTFGGPPVYPYQPAGVWLDAAQGKYVYKPSEGKARYRRSLYGFWRRNVAPTFMFDAADRRTCRVNVVRTNSPMHALNLLNDQTYVEAARALAVQVLDQGGDTTKRQLDWAFRKVLSRLPDELESHLLRDQFVAHLGEFSRDKESAEQLTSIGQDAEKPPYSPVEVAAMTATMNILLNLDEALNVE